MKSEQLPGPMSNTRVSCAVTDPKTGREARKGAPSSDGNLGENQHFQVLQIVSHG